MNGLLELAKRQLSARTKTRYRTAARRQTEIDKSPERPDHQQPGWEQWRRKRLDMLLAGPQAVREDRARWLKLSSRWVALQQQGNRVSFPHELPAGRTELLQII
jgi:hypothetical protein